MQGPTEGCAKKEGKKLLKIAPDGSFWCDVRLLKHKKEHNSIPFCFHSKPQVPSSTNWMGQDY